MTGAAAAVIRAVWPRCEVITGQKAPDGLSVARTITRADRSHPGKDDAEAHLCVFCGIFYCFGGEGLTCVKAPSSFGACVSGSFFVFWGFFFPLVVSRSR